MKKCSIPVLILLVMGFSVLSAQDQGDIHVYAAQGSEFIVLSQGKRIIYSEDRIREGSVFLSRGDMFQTGPQSFAEIRIGPGGPLVAVAENTSLRVNVPGEAGPSDSVNLFYGRVRIKREASGGLFYIQTGGTSSEIGSGDAGVDYTLRPGTSGAAPSMNPILEVSVFSGEVRVIPGASLSITPFTVSAYEGISLETSGSFSYVQRYFLDNSIIAYWNLHGFSNVPPIAAAAEPGSVTPETPSVSEIRYVPPDYTPYMKANKAKNLGIGAGILFSVAGLTLQGFGLHYLTDGQYNNAELCFIGGTASMGVGLISLISSIITNPPKQQ
ncbi:hypothetical protein [Breznakiella homolactica]|uniref:FecR protein domain-containing protein n=1 Tax=Breznakiella homolactica TaxID=2798577 RepID=A0A7T8BD50_9SPIR|nr:hypothetical protein [Breznakiella homolactica]QQO10893.1 hypothetical protein JFL75_08245 [Breznakiella homolactica]